MSYSNNEIKKKLQDWCDNEKSGVIILSVGDSGEWKNNPVGRMGFIINATFDKGEYLPLDYANYVDKGFYQKFMDAADSNDKVSQKKIVQVIKRELVIGIHPRTKLI